MPPHFGAREGLIRLTITIHEPHSPGASFAWDVREFGRDRILCSGSSLTWGDACRGADGGREQVVAEWVESEERETGYPPPTETEAVEDEVPKNKRRKRKK